MPNLAANHPQFVHFAIALLFLGVAFRLISLTGRLRFLHHSATVLLVLGTIAAVFSVESGDDAHGPVERIPGVRNEVIVHEDHGVETRNLFLGVVALELIALAMAAGWTGAKVGRYAKFAYVASGLVGIAGSWSLYETAEHGGAIVYAYGGGPGLRSGEAADISRLLTAGLYNQAMADRKAGRHTEAARLLNELATRNPADTAIRLIQAESMLLDAKDYPGALAAVHSVSVDSADVRMVNRQATLLADAYLAMGFPDSARAVLAPVVARSPQNTRLKAKLDSIP